MHRQMLKSQLHGVRLTGLTASRPGSVEVDLDLLIAADILPGELVTVLGLYGGSRTQAAVAAAPAGSGVVGLWHPAPSLDIGDLLVLESTCLIGDGEVLVPRFVSCDRANRISNRSEAEAPSRR